MTHQQSTPQERFSFPNRIALSKPHGLPRWLSVLPKPIGKPIGKRVLTSKSKKYEYYVNSLFPFSPIGARRLLSRHFRSVEYITIDESVKSTEIYGESPEARAFVTMLPTIKILTKIPPMHWLFELIWTYCGYSCSTPIR